MAVEPDSAVELADAGKAKDAGPGPPPRAATPPSATAGPTVTCGSSACSVAPNPLAALLRDFGGFETMLPMPVGCCVDAERGQCGIAPSDGADCSAHAVPDERCPGLGLSRLSEAAEGMNQVGCCIEGLCGQDGALLGLGCVENDEAASTFGFIPLVGRYADFPAARSCSVDDTDADAGR